MRPAPLAQLAAALTALACLATPATAQVEAGVPAPSFDIADARDTGIKDFHALRGKVLMLDFFATW